jgi:hypothetical protein
VLFNKIKIKNKMNKYFTEFLVGTILGNAHLGRTGLNKAFISFEQSKAKLSYMNYLYNLVKNEGLELGEIRTYLKNDSRYNKTNESLYFRTKSIEGFKPLADLFLDDSGKKVIPLNISEHFTLRSLAF